MTNEEAREILEKLIPQPQRGDGKSITHLMITEALTMAINALEQKSVLDKIKVEIDLKQYDFMGNKDYDEGIRFGLMLAYQIIDKVESKDEELKVRS